jgi:cysteine desulfurase
MQKDAERLGRLRDRLNEALHKNLDEIYINGSMEHRLPHNRISASPMSRANRC